MSILIVDSSPGPLLRLKAIFEEQGLSQLHLAKTAAEARALIDARAHVSGGEQLTLVVIDSKLEDADGLEFCRQIRALPAVKSAWVILLVTSSENKTAIENARHSGADDFAIKPYDGAEFRRHLAAYAARKTVLLVEDDPVIRQMLAALLHKQQLELIAVDHGLKAYNMINALAPARLVLLDIGLPGMNGVKLVGHIRSKPQWRKTPVVMISGSQDAADVKGSLTAGANDYIVKPFQLADLHKRLDKYFSE